MPLPWDSARPSSWTCGASSSNTPSTSLRPTTALWGVGCGPRADLASSTDRTFDWGGPAIGHVASFYTWLSGVPRNRTQVYVFGELPLVKSSELIQWVIDLILEGDFGEDANGFGVFEPLLLWRFALCSPGSQNAGSKAIQGLAPSGTSPSKASASPEGPPLNVCQSRLQLRPRPCSSIRTNATDRSQASGKASEVPPDPR